MYERAFYTFLDVETLRPIPLAGIWNFNEVGKECAEDAAKKVNGKPEVVKVVKIIVSVIAP